MDELKTARCRIVDHAYRSGPHTTDTMRIGFHCPACGAFYHEGRYTLEAGEYFVAEAAPKSCCGSERPTPKTFETIGEIEAFLRSCNCTLEGVRARFVRKAQCLGAHFCPRLVAEARRKRESALH